MKYKTGDIVTLYDGRVVYIMNVNNKEKKYTVFITENDKELFEITETDIFMKLT